MYGPPAGGAEKPMHLPRTAVNPYTDMHTSVSFYLYTAPLCLLYVYYYSLCTTWHPVSVGYFAGPATLTGPERLTEIPYSGPGCQIERAYCEDKEQNGSIVSPWYNTRLTRGWVSDRSLAATPTW